MKSYVLLEFFVALGIAIGLYTIHLENEIERNRGCKEAEDCTTCGKLPGSPKHIAECVSHQCFAVLQQGFVCKGKKEGSTLPQGGQCRGGKQWMPCPEYEAMCDLGAWSKCSKVFSSPWSHILVHWGIAKKGGPLDYTLPQLGIVWFLLLAIYPLVRRSHPYAPTLFSLAGAGSLCFNGYLGWVLKTQLQEFCIVCASTYVANVSSVLCVWTDWRASRCTSVRNGTNGNHGSNGKKTSSKKGKTS